MVTGATTVDELLARCSADALDDLTAAELAAFAVEFLGWWTQLDAARLRLIAAVDARAVCHLDGARDTTAWLATHAGDRRGSAHRDVELAVAVAAQPVLADALANGTLTRAKAAELTRATTATPAEQAELVAAATTLTPEQLARRVDQWQLDQGPVAVEESLRVTPTAHGGRLDATLDAEGFEWVHVAVDTAARQLPADDTSWPQRRARGLVGICRYFLDHADVPMTRLGRPTVVVTVDIDTLAATHGGHATLDSGATVPGLVARRLACHADLVRLVTSPASQPLDVGRRTRTPSAAQARAVIHRDRHCRYQHCTAPPWACEIHHLDHWARGGHTNLDRLALLCWHHHTLAHHHADTHHLTTHDSDRLLLTRRRTSQSDAA
jgi:hypothetical protein